jgi:hypothetical protein
MEEHKIKSAREIAMEKMSRIPDLTPEELLKQEETEYRPIGEAITQKYLIGAIKSSELPAELNKLPKIEGRFVKKYFISSMLQSIELSDPIKSLRVMSGLEVLVSNPDYFKELKKEFAEYLKRFNTETSLKEGEYASRAKESLKRLGISGPAVQPNLNIHKEWLAELDMIRKPYDEKINQLRTNIRQLTGTG